MAYYSAFIAQWNTLTPGSTAAKLAQINAQTVTGSVPALVYCTGAQIFNCLRFSEFNALTPAQQTQLMQLCAIPGPLLGGASSQFISPFFAAIAASMPQTITSLNALAQALVTPWYLANGYPAPFNQSDCAAAGVS